MFAMGMEAFKPRPNVEEEPSELLGPWKRFGFPGQPPRAGSLAEKRLLDNCQAYTDLVLSENSGAGSDKERRRLHNEIAVMIFGKTRDEVDYDLAEKISDFASIISTGDTLKQALQNLEDARQSRLVNGE